jgi:EKC/KEOPS complex subunit PCC1/LAGE3
MTSAIDPDFPCSLCDVPRSAVPQNTRLTHKERTIDIPLPTPRLAGMALRALQVDVELSPLVRRSFSQVGESVLRPEYKATTNRMLRVAVNGFMESVGVVLNTMEELDMDVLSADHAA